MEAHKTRRAGQKKPSRPSPQTNNTTLQGSAEIQAEQLPAVDEAEVDEFFAILHRLQRAMNCHPQAAKHGVQKRRRGEEDEEQEVDKGKWRPVFMLEDFEAGDGFRSSSSGTGIVSSDERMVPEKEKAKGLELDLNCEPREVN